MYFTPFIQGFGTSAGLIIAIGAQNAFLLTQSIRGRHHVLIASICIVCDAVFITIGVAGVGAAISAHPSLSHWVAWGGAAFLIVYGYRSLCSAIRGGSLDPREQTVQSLRSIIVTTLAVTLLNPHFYLDTVVLLGGISSQFYGEMRLVFWFGAISASTLWFLCLGLGGGMLAPVFRTRLAWRILDILICATMWIIAASLIFNEV